MTSNLAISLLRQGRNGDQILSILESIAADVEQAGIAECAAHYAAISAPTAEPIQF